MSERWVGMVVQSDKVIAVDANVPAAGALVIQSDQTWALQAGDRPAAYRVMHKRVSDYVREYGISRVYIKGSATSRGAMGKAHLESAELRGVVAAAAASVVETKFSAKNQISRNFGARKVDEYIVDNAFWSSEVLGSLRVGSREAAILLLAAREDN